MSFVKILECVLVTSNAIKNPDAKERNIFPETRNLSAESSGFILIALELLFQNSSISLYLTILRTLDKINDS